MSRHRLIVLSLASLLGGFGAFACGDGATEPPTSVPPQPGTVTVTQAMAVLSEPGATVQLEARVGDRNGGEMTGVAVTWSSSAPSVATVDVSGLVSAAGRGVATITATAGNVAGMSKVTVADPDRAALEALYSATDGPNWVNNENWLTDAPLAEWYGVRADGSGRVVELSLAGRWDSDARGWVRHGLSGVIPTELANLARLEVLHLGTNDLSGPIPAELGRLVNLERLDLGNNDLSGAIPPELGSLASLERLHLGSNSIEGAIPSELGGLVNLERLYLDSNDLTGAIPAELGDLTSLKRLYLYSSGLTGSIPSELGDLVNLERLYLGNNGLTGPIPPELGRLADLQRLYLENNGLTGAIPSELGSLADLERLHLSRNDLGGPVPASLAGLESLESLTVSGNDVCVLRSDSVFVAWLAGTDHDLTDLRSCSSDREVLVALYEAMGGPGWTDATNWLTEEPLGSWHGVTVDSAGGLTHLDLSQNGLTGKIAPELADLFGLRELLLDRNELTGTIPRELGLLSGLTRLSLHTNRLTGAVPAELARLPTLEHLRVANNTLCIRRSVAAFADWLAGVDHDAADLSSCPSDREVLEALYNATDGPNWRNSENWLTDAPLGEWWGVETDTDGQVVRLKLSRAHVDGQYLSQGLAGELPPELGGLTQLVELTIEGNDLLAGSIPPELGNLANLKHLTLGSNGLTDRIPAEIGQLGKLEQLRLGDNALTGAIPRELGWLSNLERLDLGWNDLSGAIPPELGGLPNLERLELGSNELSGAIPPELGGLSNLTRLTLGWNELSGAIPPELGGLSNLEWLSLDSNSLTGPIPHSFLRLDELRGFRIERNESLCVPGVSVFVQWLHGIEFRDEEAISCNAADMVALTRLFEVAGGTDWVNSNGWLGDFALEEWFGVGADSLGRVTALDLSRNGLAGRLPGFLGDLAHMTQLRITGNTDLSGRLPRTLGRLSLRVLHYSGTDVCAPVETTFLDWLNTIPSHEGTSAECTRLYPINVTWHWCDWTPAREECLTVREIDPDTVASLPVHMVSGMRAGIAEWAQVLAPTPAPAPYVIGTPRWWTYGSCRAWRERGRWAPGDTLRAGLDLHVVLWVDADPGDDQAPGAGGPRCLHDTWYHGDTLVPVVAGFINVNPFSEGTQTRSHLRWRRFAMHELGHVVGVSRGHWQEYIEATPVGGGWSVTREVIVAAFNRLGGRTYPGKKVPLSEGHLGHWHPCVAYNDIMSGTGGNWEVPVITDLSLSALMLGLQWEPQGYALPTDRWDECPELRQ